MKANICFYTMMISLISFFYFALESRYLGIYISIAVYLITFAGVMIFDKGEADKKIAENDN